MSKMKFIIITGLSGSGKSIALNTLEDLDYYCIDNLPVGMLKAIAEHITGDWGQEHQLIAVGIDARNSANELLDFPKLLSQLSRLGLKSEIIYLQADEDIILKRFSETRRKHPLTQENKSLRDAIKLEQQLLEPIAANADLFIDTTETNIYQLRDLVRERIADVEAGSMSLLFQSFGYKRGTPSDADFIFDVRCLPNPHWDPSLRQKTGLDPEVQTYLNAQEDVIEMIEQIRTFLDCWIPRFEKEARSYLTISIGCTGGQHRSVFLAETLGNYFCQRRGNVLIRHREIA